MLLLMVVPFSRVQFDFAIGLISLYFYFFGVCVQYVVSVNGFYLILMESKVIVAKQPKYLVTLRFMEFSWCLFFSYYVPF